MVSANGPSSLYRIHPYFLFFYTFPYINPIKTRSSTLYSPAFYSLLSLNIRLGIKTLILEKVLKPVT